MPTSTILKYALVNALWTAMYIILIATSMNMAPVIFGNGPDKTVLIPIVMLSLFVFSAALCGALFLGRPILWYLDGKKKEAVTLFVYTLGIFLVVTVMMLIVLYFTR